jgi:hypothetical protein
MFLAEVLPGASEVRHMEMGCQPTDLGWALICCVQPIRAEFPVPKDCP